MKAHRGREREEKKLVPIEKSIQLNKRDRKNRRATEKETVFSEIVI